MTVFDEKKFPIVNFEKFCNWIQQNTWIRIRIQLIRIRHAFYIYHLLDFINLLLPEVLLLLFHHLQRLLRVWRSVHLQEHPVLLCNKRY
jgi:hypothetical protein